METMTNSPAPIGEVAKSPRLEWLDAMRGFTMILVVAYHIAQISFGVNEKTSSSLPFLMLFRMPLFFFVSGFLAYKANFLWNWPNALSQTWKKVKIQVLPTLVFLCVFLILRRNDFFAAFEHSMKDPTKSGYWFTWVLLHMFLIYYLACMLQAWLMGKGKWLREHPHLVIWLLFLLSLFAYETLYMPNNFTYHKAAFFRYSSLVKTINFLPFFLFGNLAHRYWQRVGQVFDSRWFFPLLMIVAFVSCAEFFRWHTLRFEWTNLPRTIAMFSLLTLVVMFFRHYQEWFTHDKAIGRSLQYIGVRTLDIYLLHYILLPKLPQVGVWLNTNRPNFVMEIVTSFSVALVVISFCLLISQMLRVSPLFRKYLFGRN